MDGYFLYYMPTCMHMLIPPPHILNLPLRHSTPTTAILYEYTAEYHVFAIVISDLTQLHLSYPTHMTFAQ
jgi:hypothetical protein